MTALSVAYRKCDKGRQTESFQNVGGGGGAKVYTMYYLFKSLGRQELT